MNKEEIIEKYSGHICATQMEFDRIMSEMNRSRHS